MIPVFIKKMFPDTFKRNFKETLEVPSLYWSLTNIKKFGFTSKAFTEVFPQAKVLMCEAQAQKKEKLESLSKLYDITQLMRRPFDKALYQSDFLFIKKTSPLVAVKRWN